jgi:hypothetical protein
MRSAGATTIQEGRTHAPADMARRTAGRLGMTATMGRAGRAATTIASSVAGSSTAIGRTSGFASADNLTVWRRWRRHTYTLRKSINRIIINQRGTPASRLLAAAD